MTSNPQTPRLKEKVYRVAVVPERYGQVLSPCASIRAAGFFDRLRHSRGMEVRFLLPEELKRYNPDLVFWHRVSMPDMRSLDELEDIASKGTRLVYDLDDNLLDLDDHGEKGRYGPMTASVRRSVAMADEVWSSTARLAARLRLETKANIEVLPNALDPVLWRRQIPDMTSAAAGPLRMLYMGTRTHDQDFALIAAALDILHYENPGLCRLTLIGATTARFGTRPWLTVMDPPAHVGASYPAFVHWFKSLQGFDLGLAPLLEGVFNDCKSSIKVLDYAALGLPTLASRVPAYSRPLVDGFDCILTENSPQVWADSIRSLSAQRTMLSDIAVNASALVSESVFAAGTESRLQRLRSVNATARTFETYSMR